MSNEDQADQSPTPSESSPFLSALSAIPLPVGLESFPEMAWYRHRCVFAQGAEAWGYAYTTEAVLLERYELFVPALQEDANFVRFEYERTTAPSAEWLARGVADLRRRAAELLAYADHHEAVLAVVRAHGWVPEEVAP